VPRQPLTVGPLPPMCSRQRGRPHTPL
jgi:hypothetical protein